MKVRDSGMPEVELWNSFFDVTSILSRLGVDRSVGNLIEIGCGYGTFTLPAAQVISGQLFAYDIDPEMILYLDRQLAEQHIGNVRTECRDILEATTGLSDHSADYVMLFNILHYEYPRRFFDEAYRNLKPGGRVGVIHWRSDIKTPRGPDLAIRPKPEDIVRCIDQKRFELSLTPVILEPYHYGMVFRSKKD
ncbi:MAG: class I SAM-dependent methyltransferase [Porphyromonadaceae bacterium]|nr:class I SAM-dependent methyltransferase [Porphyromonadaceae bacterium]